MRLKNMLAMGLGAAAANLFRKKTPLNVVLSVTNRCTSSCAYCGISGRQQRELSTGDILSLIDQIADLGCQRLGLWGGEPLLREDIGEIVGRARVRGLFVTMDSNGHLVPENIPLLEKLDHLVLSLDGPEAMHDLNRGPGSYRKVAAAIEAATGRVPLWTITVLTKHNLGGIDFILDRAVERGFMATFQLLHHNDLMGRNHDALLPSGEEYRQAVRRIIERKKGGAPVASTYRYLDHLLNWDDFRAGVSPVAARGAQCWAGSLYCNVDTDGTVYPCSLLTGKTAAPDFRESGFKHAFASLQRPAQCASCIASCFTEYNYLYSLDLRTIAEWVRSLKRSGVSCMGSKE